MCVLPRQAVLARAREVIEAQSRGAALQAAVSGPGPAKLINYHMLILTSIPVPSSQRLLVPHWPPCAERQAAHTAAFRGLLSRLAGLELGDAEAAAALADAALAALPGAAEAVAA